MIVVKIEIWPFGDQRKARELGRVEIVNDGKGTQDQADYDVRFHDELSEKRVKLQDHRRGPMGFWRLVRDAMGLYR